MEIISKSYLSLSHAAAYAYVAYRTAYLKCHYGREYMASLLSGFLDSANKVSENIAECHRMGIPVLAPHVNESQKGFAVYNKAIRFGLLAVKNLGGGVIDRMLIERERNGDFKDLYDFCDRLFGQDLNRRAVESLVKCGAFDGLGANRHQMMDSIDAIFEQLSSRQRNNVEGQFGFFDMTDNNSSSSYGYNYPEVPEYPEKTLLNMERDVTGLYLSGHPMADYEQLSRDIGATDISEILGDDETAEFTDGKRVRLLVQISSVKQKATKSGQQMAFLTVEDMYGSISVMLFPKTLSAYSRFIQPDAVLVIDGKISVREERDPEIIAENIYQPNAAPPFSGAKVVKTSKTEKKPPEKPSNSGLYIRVPSLESREYERAKRVLDLFGGDTRLIVVCSDTGKRFVAPSAMWVSVNEPMIAELKDILGADNVAVRE